MEHVEPLSLIRTYLANYSPDSTTRREDLVRRVNAFQLGLTSAQVQLAVDCLIAAGLGNEYDQERTVYCRASYE